MTKKVSSLYTAFLCLVYLCVSCCQIPTAKARGLPCNDISDKSHLLFNIQDGKSKKKMIYCFINKYINKYLKSAIMFVFMNIF